MLTKEKNELLTQVGPGTPCGELLRRYWQPAALSEELPPGGAPLPVRLLGEDLVLFRDEQGRPGLLGLHCSHRGADLSYGRVEDGGLRCLYHGWLYDTAGRCLEQPGEPAGSSFHDKIRHPAYPCYEKGGIILAYLGPDEPPLVPAYRFLSAPDDHVYAVKLFSDCNYLQGNEGNLDLLHVSFLHYSKRDLQPDQPLGPVHAGAGNGAVKTLSSRGAAPFLETVEGEAIDLGVRFCKIRKIGPDENYIRVATFMLPNLTAVPGGQVNWHVPIDDEHHWKYTIMFENDGPIDRGRVSRRNTMTPDYKPIANKSNRYLQDRASMQTESYSGIDPSFFQQQDLYATEGAGAIQDRTQEHLAPSDASIAMARNLLLRAIRDVQEGIDPPHVVRDPEQNAFPDIVTTFGTIPSALDWKDYCRQLAAEGRGWISRRG